MRERWEGDQLFCTVWVFISITILDKANYFAEYGIPVSDDLLSAMSQMIMIALISGLFWGPSQKRISKKLFWGILLISFIILIMAEIFM